MKITGLVLSDLHLLSMRSSGEERLEEIREELSAARVIVMNGDTFDFRWNALSSQPEAIRAAISWLEGFLAKYPHAEVHFVLGNHDCLVAFVSQLEKFAAEHPRFHWHGIFLRLGTNLFVHGDCAHRPMDAAGLASYRSHWTHDKPMPRFVGRGYRVVDRLRITGLAHRYHFTRAKTIASLTWYLDQTLGGWRQVTSDCYFGHTHLPFKDHEEGGIRFHNTGSAIVDAPFQPLEFSWSG